MIIRLVSFTLLAMTVGAANARASNYSGSIAVPDELRASMEFNISVAGGWGANDIAMHSVGVKILKPDGSDQQTVSMGPPTIDTTARTLDAVGSTSLPQGSWTIQTKFKDQNGNTVLTVTRSISVGSRYEQWLPPDRRSRDLP